MNMNKIQKATDSYADLEKEIHTLNDENSFSFDTVKSHQNAFERLIAAKKEELKALEELYSLTANAAEDSSKLSEDELYDLIATPREYFTWKSDPERNILIRYTGNDLNVIIPRTNNASLVTEIEGTFYKLSALKSVVIPNSVTSISKFAFSGCSSLTEINIPDNVTSIGEHTFSDCSSLTEINIPDNVTSIGKYAFSGCKSLTKINIPDNVTSIGEYAFSGCSSLTEINIPDSVTSIGEFAFRDCRSLTEITIPDNITFIGEYAFRGCSSLTKAVIQNDNIWFSCNIFSRCPNLVIFCHQDSKMKRYAQVNNIKAEYI